MNEVIDLIQVWFTIKYFHYCLLTLIEILLIWLIWLLKSLWSSDTVNVHFVLFFWLKKIILTDLKIIILTDLKI